ncbi:carbon-nitrogen hydrolase family protein [Hydrocarboniclastica marina]|nr:carbon-nitrogen hydrolase family protein [Hydrocarboniclastica marina]
MDTAAEIALIQMVSGRDPSANLARVRELLKQASEQGASIAVLPENFASFYSAGMRTLAEQETTTSGPIRSFLADQARELGIWIVAGSLPMAIRPDGSPVPAPRVRATCWVIDDQGREVARYDKIHLFDAEVGDAQGSYKESDTFEPGDELVCVDTPAGRLGLSICYDLRFPELYRGLVARGATWVVVPAAFTWRTGQAHWETLLRARAIEDQVWVCAPNQGGQHDSKRRTWGHSMMIDPWGTVVRSAEEGEQLLLATLDPARVGEVRRAMPAWQNRRL